jgi:hypothetical protein
LCKKAHSGTIKEMLTPPRTDERNPFGLDAGVQPPQPTDEDLKIAWEAAHQKLIGPGRPATSEFDTWLRLWKEPPTAAQWEEWQLELLTKDHIDECRPIV